MNTSQEKLWQASPEFIENSNLKKYEKWLATTKGLHFDNYEALWAWSTENIEAFWESIWQYFDIIHHSPYQQVLSNATMPGATWFEGATLNYAEHIFRHKSLERSALIFQNEEQRLHISWQSLERRVKAVQQYLIREGIGQGDCVAAYLPNIPDAIVCFLAVNSLGAIWSCCSPDFGVHTVIDRFSQIEPKLLIAADGYKYNGKPYSKLTEIEAIRSNIPSIEACVFIAYLDKDSYLENSITVKEIYNTVSDYKSLSFTAVPFSHPIWVLYSSGTTGRPKAITHSHGGVLLEHLKYMAFHNDVHAGEHFFWFTTTGWMMWNFLQASLLVGATPVLFDGSPAYPSINALWQLAQDLPIHHFGTSAPYLTTCMKLDLPLQTTFNLSALRSIGSTGAPLPPEAFSWIYKNIKEDLWLCSMSGGTDVCTAFVGGVPNKPVYKGAIQARALGCALHGYDENGDKIKNSLGEMVIEKPMPSMPIYFWNDTNNQRYLASYFENFPGKWRHGDWIKLFDNGSLIIHGRSDATLNRKGIRIGTAEIYNVLEGIPELKDSMILNLEQEGGKDIMPLFVVLAEDASLDEALKNKIKTALRQQCSPRHVPDKIFIAPDIPYTLSGKKMEVPVKKILMGMNSNVNKDAIRNPEAMDFFLGFTLN
jgi:acetoacetyl-CoA synthetase